jgi:hypothetical protein
LLQALLLLLGARLLLRSTRRRLLCNALRLLLHCTGSYFRRSIVDAPCKTAALERELECSAMCRRWSYY